MDGPDRAQEAGADLLAEGTGVLSREPLGGQLTSDRFVPLVIPGGPEGQPPALCLHVNERLQVIPTLDRHTVPSDCFKSAPHVALAPLQESATSQTPAGVRHVWPDARNWHVAVQHDVALPFEPPRSHCSLPSSWASPQLDV